MSNFQGSNDPLFPAYPAGPVYHDSPINFSYQYKSGESSSSALTRNLPETSSQNYMPSDLPELYYDQSWPSPPSATSLNMVSTPPPQDWQASWQLPESAYAPNDPPYLPTRWQASSHNTEQVLRPTIAPIDTNCTWNNFPQRSTESPCVPLEHYGDFDKTYKSNGYPPYPQSAPFENAKTLPNFGFSPSSTSSNSPSSATTSFAVIPDPVPTSSSCPPTMSQPPLKLHQPRPSRRIPIISLSHLASACDEISTYPKQPNSTGSEKNKNAHTSLPSMSSFATAMDSSSNQFIPPSFPSRNNGATYIPTYLVGNPNTRPSAVITCSCGCGQSTSSYA